MLRGVQVEWETDRQALPALTFKVYYDAVFELIGACIPVLVSVLLQWYHRIVLVPATDQWVNSTELNDYIALATQLLDAVNAAPFNMWITDDDLVIGNGKPKPNTEQGNACATQCMHLSVLLRCYFSPRCCCCCCCCCR